VTDSPSPETNTNPSDAPKPTPAVSESNVTPADATQADATPADATPSDATPAEQGVAIASEAAASAHAPATASTATASTATPSPASDGAATQPEATQSEATKPTEEVTLPTVASDVTRKALAQEFSLTHAAVDHLVEALGAGLEPPFLGRFDRARTQLPQEGLVRRFVQRLEELDDVDRRRGTILRTLEGATGVSPRVMDLARSTVDRHVLEDLYLPYRQPEPEVQMALDRGLGALADRLATSLPKSEAARDGASTEVAATEEATPDGVTADVATAEAAAAEVAAPTEEASTAADAPNESTAGATEMAPETDATATADAATEPEAEAATEAAPEAAADSETNSEAGAETPQAAESKRSKGAPKPSQAPVPATEPALDVTADLARACADFVAPDHDVHSERDALEGAMRVLSDRLGRNAELRAQLRKIMLRHAIVKTRAGSNDERMKRHKGLLKLDTPVRQLQGSRLLGLRQAQRERALHVSFEVAAEHVLPRIKAALSRRPDPRFDRVLDVVAWRAWTRRLRPVLDEDLRLDLKVRADDEATRLLSGQIRQLLMAPTLGPRPAAGIDIDARGDLTIVAVDPNGALQGPEVRIPVAGKDDLDLAEALADALRPTGVQWVALAAGRGTRDALVKVRRAVSTLGAEAVVTVVNDVGLSAYANSETARRDLPDVSVPGRMAAGLARRLQDPMAELLKLEPRHWGIGTGTGLLTKAAAKRVVRDAVQSCVCTVGVDMERATREQLAHLPGIDRAKAARLIELRDAGELGSRTALANCGLFDEVALRNVVAFMRFRTSDDPFDRSSMHPDQYELASQLIEATGRPFLEVYTCNGGLKGLKRSDFKIDEATWRDLQREITYPGRDPRPRLFPPKMLAPGTLAESLEKGQPVEGIVTTVTNFGAFIDIGADKEGLVHVSRVSSRFVRDAREALSVGQVVRAIVIEPSAQRIGLSIKDAPTPERPERGRRPEGGGRTYGRGRSERPDGEGGERGARVGAQGGAPAGGGGRGRGERGERGGGGGGAWPQPQRLSRVAHTRRDGMPGQDERGGGGGRGRGGPGGGGAGGARGRGGPGGGRGRDGAGRDGGARREDLAALGKGAKAGYSPFASFFKSDDEPAKPKAAPKVKPAGEAADQGAPASGTDDANSTN
jgi:protein Tex